MTRLYSSGMSTGGYRVKQQPGGSSNMNGIFGSSLSTSRSVEPPKLVEVGTNQPELKTGTNQPELNAVSLEENEGDAMDEVESVIRDKVETRENQDPVRAVDVKKEKLRSAFSPRSKNGSSNVNSSRTGLPTSMKNTPKKGIYKQPPGGSSSIVL
eukprot:GHVH01002659.1.p1 GENE.GHVH01002659.1~~GHVH01002659.1.p1  ORF type:complete len:155 (+),score=23.34 GHVH01002659.1:478-942(+)